MADPPFHCFTTEGRGRGLAASRTINPGEEILREEPTALVLFQNGSKTATGAAASEECHELLAQLLVASEHPELREDCARLVSSVDMFRARDPVLIEQVSQLATPRVRELLKARGEHLLNAVEGETDDEVLHLDLWRRYAPLNAADSRGEGLLAAALRGVEPLLPDALRG